MKPTRKTPAARRKEDAHVARLAEAWQRTHSVYVGGYAIPTRPGARHWPSLDEAAEREGLTGIVGKKTLQARAAREGWNQKQQENKAAYHNELDLAVRDQLAKRAQSLAVQKMESNDEDFALGRALRAKIAQGLNVLPMQESYADTQGQTRWRMPRGSAYHLAQLSLAALNVQKITRLASGQSTENVSTRDGKSDADTAQEMLDDLMEEISRHALVADVKRGRGPSGNGSTH